MHRRDPLKVCKDCGVSRSPEDFHRHSRTLDRLQVICKDCMRVRNREWKARNPEKLAEYERRRPRRTTQERREHQLRQYGITQQRYDELVEQQGGRCAICQQIPTPTARTQIALFVDHCHATDKVRGLLCHNCNCAIGHMKDDIKRLRAAIAYLEDA